MARAQFLVLALLCVHALLGALCLAAARGASGSPGLRGWGRGMLAYAAGLALTLGLALPRPVAAFLGNTLIAASAVLAIQGALHYGRARLSAAWWGPGLALTAVALAAGNFVAQSSLLANFVAPTVFASLVFGYGGVRLLRDPTPDATRAARFVAATLLAAVAVWWLRVLAMPSLLAEPVDRERLDVVVSSFAIAQVLLGVGATFGLLWVEVRLVQAAIARMAFTDPLTGLPNRRAIVARFEEEAARWSRTGMGFALAVFDVDRFKRVNDAHGHLAGDALLRHVARVLGGAKRTEDVLGRLGGEEFVVMMCGHQSGGESTAADRLREVVGATPLVRDGAALAVTLSGGLARFPEDGTDWDRVFAAADARLYEAKRGGRNRVVGAAAA